MIDSVRKLWARWRPLLGFSGSERYWRERYRRGGDSGAGSGGDSARFKADTINTFVQQFGIRSVIEFGCGDGRQLALSNYPSYAGYDISPEAIALCKRLFEGDRSKVFSLVSDYNGERADLAASLDVIFHLVEDSVYYAYLDRLFSSADRFVVIYSSDEGSSAPSLAHVRHRSVSHDIASRFTQFQNFEFTGPSRPLAQEKHPMRFLFYRRLTN